MFSDQLPNVDLVNLNNNVAYGSLYREHYSKIVNYINRSLEPMARHYCSTLILPWSGLICNVFNIWGTEESKKDISKLKCIQWRATKMMSEPITKSWALWLKEVRYLKVYPTKDWVVFCWWYRNKSKRWNKIHVGWSAGETDGMSCQLGESEPDGCSTSMETFRWRLDDHLCVISM